MGKRWRLFRTPAEPLSIQRAHAPPAGRIIGYLQPLPKLDRPRAVQHLSQSSFAQPPIGWMEEAGAQCAVRLPHRGNPGRVATGRLRLDLSQVSPEMPDD